MNPFEISESFTNFDEPYPKPKDFVQVLKNAIPREKSEIVRLWLSEGIPYAFKHCPLLYETIRGWLANKLNIHPKEITLIGSARIGFSLAPPPALGKPFSRDSDLDFNAISEKLFKQCAKAFRLWSGDFSKRVVSPRHSTEKFYWDTNFKTVPENIKKGFIDPYKIPTFDRYPIAKKIQNAIWMLHEKLKITDNAPRARKLSVRVYIDWSAFIRQFIINLTYAIKEV